MTKGLKQPTALLPVRFRSQPSGRHRKEMARTENILLALGLRGERNISEIEPELAGGLHRLLKVTRSGLSEPSTLHSAIAEYLRRKALAAEPPHETRDDDKRRGPSLDVLTDNQKAFLHRFLADKQAAVEFLESTGVYDESGNLRPFFAAGNHDQAW